MKKHCKRGHASGRNTHGHCIVCCRENAARYYKADPEKARMRYQQNSEKYKESRLQYKKRNQDKLCVKQRKKRGLPEPSRPEPILCECCGRQRGRTSLNLDHDHPTGKFRGWLCGSCNRGIGLLSDTIDGLQRAIDYLRASEFS